MRVSISITATLKDRPPDHLGITSRTYALGRDKPITYSNAILHFIHIVSEFYALLYSADEMNAELGLLRDRLSHVKFVEEEERPCQPAAS